MYSLQILAPSRSPWDRSSFYPHPKLCSFPLGIIYLLFWFSLLENPRSTARDQSGVPILWDVCITLFAVLASVLFDSCFTWVVRQGSLHSYGCNLDSFARKENTILLMTGQKTENRCKRFTISWTSDKILSWEKQADSSRNFNLSNLSTYTPQHRSWMNLLQAHCRSLQRGSTALRVLPISPFGQSLQQNFE